jgi:hypothetical protein
VKGTQFHFNTHTTEGTSRVALYDGVVELDHAGGTHTLEAAGKEFTLHHKTQTHSINDFDHTAKPAWTEAAENLFNFLTLGEIFDLVERNYGVTIAGREKIDIDKQLNFVFDGTVSVGDVMSILEFSHGGFSHTIEGSTVTLENKQN